MAVVKRRVRWDHTVEVGAEPRNGCDGNGRNATGRIVDVVADIEVGNDASMQKRDKGETVVVLYMGRMVRPCLVGRRGGGRKDRAKCR